MKINTQYNNIFNVDYFSQGKEIDKNVNKIVRRKNW